MDTSSSTPLYIAALLAIVEEAGVGVLTLTEELEEAELLNSRLTRAEVTRQVLRLAESADQLPAQARAELAEIDWEGWHGVGRALSQSGPRQDDALWFAVRSLVPATVMWLRVYRQEQPHRFQMTA